MGISYIRDLKKEDLDSSLVSKVPIAFSKKFRIVPLRMEDGVLTVAALDPLTHEPLDDLRVFFKCRGIKLWILYDDLGIAWRKLFYKTIKCIQRLGPLSHVVQTRTR